jgi:hypothetical protein
MPVRLEVLGKVIAVWRDSTGRQTRKSAIRQTRMSALRLNSLKAGHRTELLGAVTNCSFVFIGVHSWLKYFIFQKRAAAR